MRVVFHFTFRAILTVSYIAEFELGIEIDSTGESYVNETWHFFLILHLILQWSADIFSPGSMS